MPRPDLHRQLAEGLKRSPLLTILGPRQCVKTTLAREFCKGPEDVVFLDLEISSTSVLRQCVDTTNKKFVKGVKVITFLFEPEP
jgi:predicted AAA+ superfamily ATPase